MGGTASKAAPRAQQPLKKVTQTLAKGADQAFSPVNLPKFQAPVGPLPEMDPALIEAMNRAGPAVKTSEVFLPAGSSLPPDLPPGVVDRVGPEPGTLRYTPPTGRGGEGEAAATLAEAPGITVADAFRAAELHRDNCEKWTPENLAEHLKTDKHTIQVLLSQTAAPKILTTKMNYKVAIW